MRGLLTIILTAVVSTSFGQINMNDSTAQVIGYWNKGDKQSYAMQLQKIKLKVTDTTANEIMTYNVDITVIDSTENTYVIEWYYRNFKSNTENELMKKLAASSEDIKVLIETDELGSIRRVLNWKEVGKHMEKTLHPLEKEFANIPQVKKMIKQMLSMYTTEQGVFSAAIQDAQQFYTYHGAQYTLNELLEGQLKVPNMYNQNEPFDSQLKISLDELNPNDNNYVISSSQEVDSEQLTSVTFEYLKNFSKSMGTPEPKKKDIGQLTNLTTTASRIHGSGWVIYSIQTKTVESPGATNIEERIIEIK